MVKELPNFRKMALSSLDGVVKLLNNPMYNYPHERVEQLEGVRKIENLYHNYYKDDGTAVDRVADANLVVVVTISVTRIK